MALGAVTRRFVCDPQIRRGWDGVTVVDLRSKNGTQVDGKQVGNAPVELHAGQTLTLGATAMRFHDPAERHLRGESLGAAPAIPRIRSAAARLRVAGGGRGRGRSSCSR